jgi:hypothetical protein
MPFLQSRLGFQVVLWCVIALGCIGFVNYSRDAAFRAAHFPPDFVHPSDYYAEGCLAAVLLAGMTLFLSRIPGTAPRYRKTPTATARFALRPDLRSFRRLSTAKRVYKAHRTKRRRPLPGYNKFK